MKSENKIAQLSTPSDSMDCSFYKSGPWVYPTEYWVVVCTSPLWVMKNLSVPFASVSKDYKVACHMYYSTSCFLSLSLFKYGYIHFTCWNLWRACTSCSICSVLRNPPVVQNMGSSPGWRALEKKWHPPQYSYGKSLGQRGPQTLVMGVTWNLDTAVTK